MRFGVIVYTLVILEQAGLESDPALLIEGDHTIASGMAALAKLLERPVRPTAVIC